MVTTKNSQEINKAEHNDLLAAKKVELVGFGDSANPVRKDIEGSGMTSVGITPVEILFTEKTSSVVITADMNNTGILYVGKSNITHTGDNALTFLYAGDEITLDYDDSDNALYIVSDTALQNYWSGALL